MRIRAGSATGRGRGGEENENRSGRTRAMSSTRTFSPAVVAAGQQHVRAPRGGLPRPSRPAAGSPGQRSAGGGGDAAWGQAGRSWWGAGGGLPAAASSRRQPCRAGAGRAPAGNRELVRRALSPPATGARGAALRRWSFRPMPSRLRNVSCLTSTAAPTSPRPS
nr:translation initiation factor IF-2 [Aegilops tauschii subsp. strangulata]